MTAEAPAWVRERETGWQSLTGELFDVLVVGGGIAGAGIAWEAACRGFRTALVEERDWAGGTSSRSSKLVHGGLRYLPHGEVRLVREAGREREILARLAPHLVRPLPFLIPVYRGVGRPLWEIAMGVWLHDRLTGVPQSHRRVALDPAVLRTEEPALEGVGLMGGIRYFEARTDDARLVYTIVQAARAAGAVALSRVRAGEVSLRRGMGEVEVEDRAEGRRGTVRVRAAVNATGPWAAGLDPGGPPIALGRGIHLVFPRARLPLRHAVVLPSTDGGNTFAIPRGRVSYVGTTDRLYTGDPAWPDVPQEDVDYLFAVLGRVLPRLGLQPRDLLAVYSGVRPLVAHEGVKGTAELSRRRSVRVGADGLISVRGGKLTGFRGVSREVLELLGRRMGRPPSAAKAVQPLPGAADEDYLRLLPERLAAGFGVPADAAEELLWRHGRRAEEVLQYAEGRPHGLAFVHGGSGLLWGEVDWTVAHEEVLQLSDLLIRRTGFLWFSGDDDPQGALLTVAQRIAPVLGWSGDKIAEEVASCRREAHLDRLEALRGRA